MKNNIRILLVDDHDITRYGLRRMLESEEDMEVVGDCTNAEEAFSQVEVLFPDIVLMDVKMPGIDGIEATRRLKEKQPACTIIVLTLYEDYVAEAIKAGAAGYLLKDCKREELIQAIRAVQQGRTPLSPLNREFFARLVSLLEDADLAHLSERELAILRLIANGATTKEIGTEVFLSEASVKRDVRNILDKLGVHNRSEAVAEAYRKKIVYRE